MRVVSRFRRRSEEERAGSMTVMEHLEELRHRIIVCVIAVGVCGIAAWFLYEPVKELLRDPFCQYITDNPQVRPPAGCDLVFSGPIDGFLVKLKMVGFLGVIVALRVVLYQVWALIVPGLRSRE